MKFNNGSMLVVLTMGLATGLGANQAQAQFPYSGVGSLPENRSAYSPYLNMLRAGNSPTLNYYGLVRPELNFTSSVNGLQQQSALDRDSINTLQSGGLPTTGHPAAFLNLGGYFQSRGGLGSATGAGQSGNRMGQGGAMGQSMLNANSGAFGGGATRTPGR